MKVLSVNKNVIKPVKSVTTSMLKKIRNKRITDASISGSVFAITCANTFSRKDTEYRKELLSNVDINPTESYKIRSILGANEIKCVMSKLNNSPHSYTVGKNFENTKNGTYKANLHIHTVNSDGLFTTQELLDKAAEYGDFLKKINKHNPPFTIAITDHDTTEGVEQATKIIAANPEKYQNLQVIMGVEITVFDDIATDIVDYPTNAHILLYGINPDEPKFKNFIENTKKMKFETAQKMFECANNVYKNIYGCDSIFSIDEAKNFSTQFRESVTGMFNHVSKYVKTKFILDEIIIKNQKLKTMLGEDITSEQLMKDLTEFYLPINRNNYIQTPETIIEDYLFSKTKLDKDSLGEIIKVGIENTTAQEFMTTLDSEFEHYKITLNSKNRYVPDFEAINNALSNQKNVLVGIAHPLDYIKKLKDKNKSFIFLDKVYAKFKKVFKEKGVFCETYYQSYTTTAQQLNERQDTIPTMKKLACKYNLYNTGSLDNHRNNLFSRY